MQRNAQHSKTSYSLPRLKHQQFLDEIFAHVRHHVKRLVVKLDFFLFDLQHVLHRLGVVIAHKRRKSAEPTRKESGLEQVKYAHDFYESPSTQTELKFPKPDTYKT